MSCHHFPVMVAGRPDPWCWSRTRNCALESFLPRRYRSRSRCRFFRVFECQAGNRPLRKCFKRDSSTRPLAAKGATASVWRYRLRELKMVHALVVLGYTEPKSLLHPVCLQHVCLEDACLDPTSLFHSMSSCFTSHVPVFVWTLYVWTPP